jgi:hypothetical protein
MERTAIQMDIEGNHEFKELPAGPCIIQANAPGLTEETIPKDIIENMKAEQYSVLLPVVAIDGIDWVTGKIHFTGCGILPQNASTFVVRR